MIEIGLNDDGSLDEILAKDVSLHLEQMDDNQWWMLIREEGQTDGLHIWLTTSRAHIKATINDERKLVCQEEP